MHPVAKDVLKLLGRVGTRAVAEGIGSALDDVEGLLTNGTKRIKKVRKKLRDIPKEPRDAEEDE